MRRYGSLININPSDLEEEEEEKKIPFLAIVNKYLLWIMNGGNFFLLRKIYFMPLRVNLDNFVQRSEVTRSEAEEERQPFGVQAKVGWDRGVNVNKRAVTVHFYSLL